MSLIAETLAAATGLWPSKDAPTETHRLASAAMLDRWEAKLRRWVRSVEQEPFKWSKPPEEKALQKRILDPIDPLEEVHTIANVGEADLGAEYIAILRAGRAYLDSKWPKIPVPGVKVDVFPLSREALCEVWNLARVLDGPDTLLDEIASYSVTPSMVDAVKTIYPELTEAMRELFDRAVLEHTSRGKTLTWKQEEVYRIVQGLPRNLVIKAAEPQKPQQGGAGPATPPQVAPQRQGEALAHATPADFKP